MSHENTSSLSQPEFQAESRTESLAESRTGAHADVRVEGQSDRTDAHVETGIDGKAEAGRGTTGGQPDDAAREAAAGAGAELADNAFSRLGLIPPLVQALQRMDIAEPTPVQAKTIPLLLAGRDVIASAPTGTGKTAAFLLPALQNIASHAVERPAPAASAPREARRGHGRGKARVIHGPQVLVLTPTRELAQQVTKTSQSLARLLPRTSTVCITGGASYYLQAKALSHPYEVLVATPGRLIDQLEGGKIDLSRVRLLVLDEADRMLDMGFSDDVLGIAEALPGERQTVCFTATLSHDVRNLAGKLLKDPEWLTVERSRENLVPIDDHVVYTDNPGHRHQLLMACLNDSGLGQAIVFTATKRHAEELAEELLGDGFAVEALHGDMSQRDRTRALNRLRHGECKVLVATDVAARGIDVSTITHVINYELPRVAEDYVHRIGRTGRAGASGQAVSFVGREDVIPLHKIEHFIGRHIQVSEFPGLEAEFKPMPRKRPKKDRAGFGKGRSGGRAAFKGKAHRGAHDAGRGSRDGAHRSWAGVRHGHAGHPADEAWHEQGARPARFPRHRADEAAGRGERRPYGNTRTGADASGGRRFERFEGKRGFERDAGPGRRDGGDFRGAGEKRSRTSERWGERRHAAPDERFGSPRGAGKGREGGFERRSGDRAPRAGAFDGDKRFEGRSGGRREDFRGARSDGAERPQRRREFDAADGRRPGGGKFAARSARAGAFRDGDKRRG